MDFFRRSNWDIVGRTKIWFAISLVVILAGAISALTRGTNYGIDFTGGSLLKYQFERALVAEDRGSAEVIARTRVMLEDHGLHKSQIQVSGGDQLFIRTAAQDEDEAAAQDQQVHAGLHELFGDQAGQVSSLGRDMVGPIVGKRLRNSALLALILGSILILIYIAVRYEFRFGVAGVAALVHDVLIVIGAMALLGAELNTAFVAAILTIIGYSVHDSVVIFDRIRENMRLYRGTGFAGIVNTSLLQTMTRSINTTMTTLFALIALFFFGGAAIHAFSLALIIGITSGAYSSIFIASPIVVLWEGGRARAEQRQRRPVRAPAQVTPTPAIAAERPAERQPAAVSAQQAIERAKRDAQEEKREVRRERRKKRRDSGKRRF